MMIWKERGYKEVSFLSVFVVFQSHSIFMELEKLESMIQKERR